MEFEELKQKLEQTPADEKLVQQLYSKGLISSQGRLQALEWLHPRLQFKLWLSQLFLGLGTALVLAGVVYFCAFNWAKIPPLVKLGAIQIGMISCLAGAVFYRLQSLYGRLLLLSASVLVGVFMAVFGQIYQTGVDSYVLFLTWALAILGWTLISNFSAQWVLWLGVSNFALFLWWDQAALPSKEMEALIFAFLTLFNGIALIVREVLVSKTTLDWPRALWFRSVLVVATIIPMTWPNILAVLEPNKVTTSILVSSLIGLIGLVSLFSFYRFKSKDLFSVACTVFGACMILEFAIMRQLFGLYYNSISALSMLLFGVATCVLFGLAIMYLRKTHKHLEVRDD